MKKGLSITLFLGILVLTSGYILASSLSMFDKEISIINVGGQSIVIDQMSQQERQKISKYTENGEDVIQNPEGLRDLIDQQSISQYDISSNQLVNIPYQRVKVSYELGELNLIKFNFKGKQIVVTEKGLVNPVLYPSKDYNLYAFEQNDDIFTLNPSNNSVKKVTKDIVGSFTKNEVMNRDHPSLQVWASHPMISEDTNKLAYYSKRSNEDRFDIWVIDLNNGQEKLVVENATPITWSGKSLVFTNNDTSFSVGKINIDTNQKSTIIPKTLFSYAKGDYLVYRTDVESINHYTLYNLKDNTKVEIKTKEGSSLSTNFHFSPEGKHVVTLYHEDYTNGLNKSFLLVNLDNGVQSTVDFPSGLPSDSDDFVIQGWVNPNQFAVTFQYDQRLKSKTIVVDAIGGVK